MGTPFKIQNEKKTRGKRKLGEVADAGRSGGMDLGLRKRGARKLGAIDVPPEFRSRFSTGYEAVDLFLTDGGGLCPIQSISINAPRGGGKTTLWLQLLQGMYDGSQGDLQGLYGSGEEYVEQLALAGERTGALDVSADNLTTVEDYLDEIESGQWKVIVVDSVPSLKTSMRLLNGAMVRKADVSAAEWKESRPVPKTQLENAAVQCLVAAGKKHKCVTVFILHQTKDGKVKGDSAIEHTVDTCLHIMVPSDKDYESGFPYGAKIITCDKNRFGGTGSIVAKMGRKGWDLDNLLDMAEVKAPKNEKKEPGGERAQRKIHEMKNLIAALKTFSKPVQLAELLNKVDMPDDPTAWDRHERHLKAMVKMGKVIKMGGGKGVKTPATYEIAPEK
jgi:predicted ATP-dependent serine protease